MPQFPAQLGGPIGYIPGVNQGTENDTAETLLRKYLNPALVGPGWDAMLAAIATGDAANDLAAQQAFDQLFLCTASSTYLEQRASDVGVAKPQNIGLSDDLFRRYAIATSTSQLTELSLLQILDVFYGDDSLRAHADTRVQEPYDLSGGEDLQVVLDGRPAIHIVFDSGDFAEAGSATAAEVAAAINRFLVLNGSQGYAVSSTDPQTGSTGVRMYSGALGLASSVAFVGGTAQPWLQFPSIVPAQIAEGAAWNLTYTASTQTLRFAPSANFDVSQVQPGDYVVVTGAGFQAQNRGVLQVLDTYWGYSGATLVQYFDVLCPGGASQSGVVTGPNTDLMPFRPTPATTHAGGAREVVVAVTGDEVDVVLPATSIAVSRRSPEAAYCQGALGIAILAMQRISGTVTVQTSAGHGLSVGSQVLIDGAWCKYAQPSRITGTPPNADSCPLSIWSAVTMPAAVPYRPLALELPGGQVLFVGGNSSASFAPVTTAVLAALSATSAPPLVDVSYTLTSETALPVAAAYLAGSAGALNTALSGLGLVTGGLNGSGVALATSRSFSTAGGGTWVSTGSMNTARACHQQVTLSTGDVLVCGGATAHTSANSTTSTEIYDPATNTWTAKASMNVSRADHASVLLSNGKVLVVGGRTIASGDATTYSSSTDTALQSCEVYDPTGDTWTATGPMTFARARGFSAVLLPDERVLVAGGIGFDPTEPSTPGYISACEIWDPNTGRWSVGPTIPATGPTHLVQVPGRDQVLILVEGSSFAFLLDTVTLESCVTPTPVPATLLAGMAAIPTGSGQVVVAGGVTSGAITTAASLYVPNQDSYGGGGLNGQFQVTAVPDATHFEYATNVQTYAELDPSAAAIATPVAAPEGDFPGPYSFDPTGGVAITGTESTITTAVAAGHQYAELDVTDATVFPDSPGFLCLSFGTDGQVAPIPYLGRLSDTSLALDYRFIMTADAGVGATVALLAGKGPYVPTDGPEVGSFYLTASNAGLAGAEAAVRAAAGAGIEVNMMISYPGDRGLGGEGLPTQDATKLSDRVMVWGSDDIDEDYVEARDGEAD